MKNRKILAILIALTIILRLGVLYYMASAGKSAEPWEYETIAKNLIAGNGFKNIYLSTTYYSCTVPLYPFICAGIYKLFGVNHNTVVYFQIIVAALVTMVLFSIGKMVCSEKAGLIGAALYAFHPGLIIYCVTKLHSLNIDIFFFSLTLWFFMRLKDRNNLAFSFLAGICTGLCVLSRSTIVAFMPVGVAWLFFCLKPKKALSVAVMIILGMALAISPWGARNFIVHKQIMLTTSLDGESFWRGNNPKASGAIFTADKKEMIVSNPEFYEEIRSMSEAEQRAAFWKEGLNFVKDNPGRAAILFFKKFYFFWWFSHSSGMWYPSSYLTIYKGIYAFYLLFAAIGIYHAFAKKISVNKPDFILLILFLLSISAFQSLFYVEGRHRWGVEPVFLILTAIGILSIFQKNKSRVAKNEIT